MQHLFHRLTSLVNDCPDPMLAIYVIENLGKPIPPTSKYYGPFLRYRTELTIQLIQPRWRPNPVARPRPEARLPINLTFARQLVQQQEQFQRVMLENEYKMFMYKQFEQMAQEQAKQAETLNGLLRGLAKEDDAEVVRKLHHPEPFTRWLAIQVAGKKRMPVEPELIDLLDDPYPIVGVAAHQVLVRLSRSTDLGPAPKANAGAVETSQRNWRVWHRAQVEAQAVEESSATRE